MGPLSNKARYYQEGGAAVPAPAPAPVAAAPGTSLGFAPTQGHAARRIADYFAGPQYAPRGPLAGGYTGSAGNAPIDYLALAANRAGARASGATNAQLQAADADNRENITGYNKRQQEALALARQSSPYHQDLARRGLSVADDGVSVYHTRPDGSRDFNYSSDGQYRGPIPDKFLNPDKTSANTHLAHFNKETGQWEAGDLSLAQTGKDIVGGFTDAYSNIRSTLPLIGAEVLDAGKVLVNKGKDAYETLTGSGAKPTIDAVAARAPLARNDASASAAALRSAQAAEAQAAQKRAAAARSRDRESAGSKALKASTRAQLKPTRNPHTR